VFVRPHRRALRVLAALFAIALLAAACSDSKKKSDTVGASSGSQSSSSGATPNAKFTRAQGVPGGTVTFGYDQEYTSYNNGTADNGLTANTEVLQLVQPQPFITDGGLQQLLNTELMDSVELTSTDPQVVVWKIKQNAVWSDNAPIDCSDFYLAWLSQNGTAVSATDTDSSGQPKQLFNALSTTGYDSIGSLTCSPDGKTVTTNFSKPFADYNSLFSGTTPLLPAHILEQQTGVADITKVTPTSPDIGKVADFWNTGWTGFNPALDPSGAWYTITSFNQGQDLTLTRNPTYYGPRGLLDTIVIKQIPDSTQQPAALANNDVQVITPQPDQDLVAQVAAIPDVTYSVNFGTTFDHLDMNFKSPLFQDIAVRTAFAQCVDTQEITDKLISPLSDQAAPLGNRLLLSNQPGYKDNRASGPADFTTADPDAAKQTLMNDGWTIGADGVATKNGQRLEFKIGRIDPNPRRQQTIQLIIQQCQPAGFAISDGGDPNFNDTLLPAGQYDVALFAWQQTPQLSANQSIYQSGGGQNYQGLDDPALTAMFDELNKTFDNNKKIDLANQIDQELWKQVATIPLFQWPELVAFRNQVKNVVYNGPMGITWNAFDWSVG
jgi:peptide/nickel transport system substrate-binding protein